MKTDILIIGATGFIGARLLSFFEKQNIPCKVLARSPEKVITTSENTRVFKGDLDKPETLSPALKGVKTIYYLAHSMSDNKDFRLAEERQAKNLSSKITQGQKVIYLGGVIPSDKLSTHLRSRKRVGEILRESKGRVIEFRASIVIGHGSASFEMIRILSHRLPFLITASWTNAKCRPVAIDNVIEYLTLAEKKKFSEHKIFNIGQEKSLTYRELILAYIDFAKLKRAELYIENFPKRLAKEVFALITPEYKNLSENLFESIQMDTSFQDNEAQSVFKLNLQSLEESFKIAGKSDLEAIELKKFLKKLRDHKEIPQYLVGRRLAINLSLPTQTATNLLSETHIGKKLEEVLKTILPKSLVLSSKSLFTRHLFARKESELFKMTLPYLGVLELKNLKVDNKYILFYTPKYFFQSLGFSVFYKLSTRLTGAK